eukprot:TRINITY_DN3292_c0_g2_i5.p1 TRINITY_DN3292_c0_g2~~TRINITY_DN3292_c0_g2_i5.p1  ORF type:complete len:323 (+),score=111.10 TRINITY_DN3292_c0_g2_i5:1686-2654(+)
MPLVTLKQILDHAREHKYGVGAYNVNNMEQIQGIMMAANETNSPVIIQASRGALKYTNLIFLKKLMEAAVEMYPHIPICLHLDHGDTYESCVEAIELGFTSVMIDASHHDYEDNVRITKQVVDYAHPRGVSVEAELGRLMGVEEDVSSDSHVYTDPEQAVDFVTRTGVDALAVAIGTSHGAYKFTTAPVLQMDLINEISAKTGIPLVMHGSSSVPAELRDQINKYGGNMPNAMGVPVPMIVDAISRGISKINVDSDSRMAMTGVIRKIFAEKPGEFDPRKYLGPAREATKELIMEKMTAFGTAGHAADYEPISLEDAKKWYN